MRRDFAKWQNGEIYRAVQWDEKVGYLRGQRAKQLK